MPRPTIGRLRHLKIERLFGDTNIDLELPDAPVAIIYGANGAGKSTAMRLLRCALSRDLLDLSLDLFHSAQLTFDSGATLTIDAKEDQWRERGGSDDRRETSGPIGAKRFAEFVSRTTPFQFIEGVLLQPDGAPLDADTLASLRRRFEMQFDMPEGRRGQRDGRKPGDGAESQPARRILKPCWLIGSDRLRTPIVPPAGARARARFDWPHMDHATRGAETSAADQVAAALTRTIGMAREEARRTSEKLDNDFFKRLLQTIRQPSRESVPISEMDLRDTERRLVKCALATSKLDLPQLDIGSFVQAEKALIESAYDLYLRDLWKKATATPRVLERLEYFVDALNSHFVGKTATLSFESGLEIRRNSDGSVIPLRRLSSGEQHLIVLFHAIVFRTEDDGLCLIDEPEISLNVDWQIRFVSTVEGAANLAGQGRQFIIATHSPALVAEHAANCIEFKGS